jgi:hypothetical protein
MPLLFSACVPRSARIDRSSQFGATREVDVWTQGGRLRLHGVTWLRDSISGIPVESPACDACRLAVPLTQVDSVVIADRHISGFKVIGGILLSVYTLARLP